MIGTRIFLSEGIPIPCKLGADSVGFRYRLSEVELLAEIWRDNAKKVTGFLFLRGVLGLMEQARRSRAKPEACRPTVENGRNNCLF